MKLRAAPLPELKLSQVFGLVKPRAMRGAFLWPLLDFAIGPAYNALASRPKDIDMFNPIKKAISAIWAYLNKNRNLIILWKPTIKTIVVLEKDGNSMK